MITWANCWNGVNHPATAPQSDMGIPISEQNQSVAHRLERIEMAVAKLTEAVFAKVPVRAGPMIPVMGPHGPIFVSPPAEFQPDGGWETAR